MAKRLSTKHKKLKRDRARAYAEGTNPADCKQAVMRSKKALFRKNNRMA